MIGKETIDKIMIGKETIDKIITDKIITDKITIEITKEMVKIRDNLRVGMISQIHDKIMIMINI